MMITPWAKEFLRILRISLLSVLAILWANTSAVASSLAASDSQQETEVVVHIQTREFRPDRVSLRTGEKVRLIFRNEDAELHAFVPVGLFMNTTLNLTGNGAPQFGPDGLLRVLLPSNGQTEILFIADRPGQYPFFLRPSGACHARDDRGAGMR